MLARDKNIFVVDLQISNEAALEINRPLYSLARVEIANATVEFDIISYIDPPVVSRYIRGTELEHVARLTNATLHGDVLYFPLVELNNSVLNGDVVLVKYLDLNDSVINGDLEGVQAVRGVGTVNGNVTKSNRSTAPFTNIIPSGLIDINGNAEMDIVVDILLAGPLGSATPRLEVDTIKGLDALNLLITTSYAVPFMFNVEFDPLFHASTGDRFELLSTVLTTLNVGILAPGDFDSFNYPREVLESIEERLSNIHFINTPAGYQFDVFIDPHAIGFIVVSVPELSSFGLLAMAMVGGVVGVARHRLSASR